MDFMSGGSASKKPKTSVSRGLAGDCPAANRRACWKNPPAIALGTGVLEQRIELAAQALLRLGADRERHALAWRDRVAAARRLRRRARLGARRRARAVVDVDGALTVDADVDVALRRSGRFARHPAPSPVCERRGSLTDMKYPFPVTLPTPCSTAPAPERSPSGRDRGRRHDGSSALYWVFRVSVCARFGEVLPISTDPRERDARERCGLRHRRRRRPMRSRSGATPVGVSRYARPQLRTNSADACSASSSSPASSHSWICSAPPGPERHRHGHRDAGDAVLAVEHERRGPQLARRRRAP